MNINTHKQNRDVHKATVSQDVVHRIIAERVAEKVGVSLDGEGVTWRAYHTTRDTSTGILHDVEVEIIDDHTRKATAATVTT
jgi:hypothetical protein